MTPELLERIVAARRDGRATVLATRLPDGAQRLLDASGRGEGVSEALHTAAMRALTDDNSATVEVGAEKWFLHAYLPPLRLVVVGAVHIAQALAPMAASQGYGVVVIDPRRSFATVERFPGVTLAEGWPDEAMEALRPDRRTAIVTLTHDPKLDDPALDRALRSDAFYLGALGSRRTHAARLERLRGLGHDDASLARIRGPVGLDIGAVTAPEIALSVLADVVATRRGATIARRETRAA